MDHHPPIIAGSPRIGSLYEFLYGLDAERYDRNTKTGFVQTVFPGIILGLQNTPDFDERLILVMALLGASMPFSYHAPSTWWWIDSPSPEFISTRAGPF
jgi:hypothetical protein